MRFHTAVCLCVAGVILINITGCVGQLDVCGNVTLITNNTSPKSWPWQVSLRKSPNTDHYCSGTLISKSWVLSSAYCLQGVSTLYMRLYLGRQNQAGSNPNQIVREATQIILHDRYDGFTKDNNIALVKLSAPVSFTDYIRPVCLSGANSSFAAGTKSWFTGWGSLVDESDSLKRLQEVPAPIVNDSVCQSSCFKVITNNMICAGELQRRDACEGDSGGPLVSKMDKQWIQSGIESFGQGCGEMWCPGVYTRVSKYHNWIKSNTVGDLPGFINFTPRASGFSRNTFNCFLVTLSLTLSVMPFIFPFSF